MTKFITRSIAALGVVAGIGIAALPAMSYAADPSQNVTINVSVDPTVAADATICGETAGSGATIDFGNLAAGASGTKDCTFAFASNAAAYVKISAAETNLKDGEKTIAAFGTKADSLAPANPGWGYNVTGTGSGVTVASGLDSGYTGVTTTPTTIASTSAAITSANGTGTIQFGIQTAPNQAPGNYSGAVTITITPNA